jgi:hypothetical protein
MAGPASHANDIPHERTAEHPGHRRFCRPAELRIGSGGAVFKEVELLK